MSQNKEFYKNNPSLLAFDSTYMFSPRQTKSGDGSRVYINKLIITKRPDVVIYDLDVLRRSKTGMDMLLWIMSNIKRDRDEFKMSYNDFCDAMSSASYFRGLSELINNNVIFKSDEKNKYFININLFFKGSITKCYPDIDATILKNRHG